jgi:hypothetical protein
VTTEARTRGIGGHREGHPLEIGLGPEGMARLLQKLSGTVMELERRVWRHVPELSFPQSAKTSE